MRTKLFAICIAALALPPGCSSTRPYADQIPQFQTWYRRALTHPETDPVFRQFHDAWHGDPAALRAYFSDAWRQMHATYINAEGGEALSAALLVLIRRVGDDAFSSVLAQEPAKVRSAVAASTNVPSFKPYPKTYQLLIASPKIDFPLHKLYRLANRETLNHFRNASRSSAATSWLKIWTAPPDSIP